MNLPAQSNPLGCLHHSPASVSHTRSTAHFHRRPAKSLRIQAVIETETHSPVTSNGSAARVRVSPGGFKYGVAVDAVALNRSPGVQAGVPPGTPTVDTLVRKNMARKSVRAFVHPSTCIVLTFLFFHAAGPALKAKEKPTQPHNTPCILRDSPVSRQPHTAGVCT